MKKVLSFLTILVMAVFCSACINSYAVQQLNKKAKEYSDHGDYKSAISRLESSLDLDANIFETRFNLAVAYFNLRDCAKAKEQIDVAESLSINKDAAVYYIQGVVNNCLADEMADSVMNDTKVSGKNTAEFSDNYKNARKYIEYLTAANTAYGKYLESAPSTDMTNEITAVVETNNSEISNCNSKYGF